MRRRGQVVLRESLLESLYGFDEEVTENAVEAAIYRLRRGLGAAGASVIIHTLRGVGYMLEDAPRPAATVEKPE
jgi:two-component system response regulator QseB